MKRISFFKYGELPQKHRPACATAIRKHLGWSFEEMQEEICNVMKGHYSGLVEDAIEDIMNWNGLYYSPSYDAIIVNEEEMNSYRAGLCI